MQVQLPAHKSICADMALVILPNRVTGFTGPFGIKFAQLSPAQLLAEGQAAEIFALGYGITECESKSLIRGSQITIHFQFQPTHCQSIAFHFFLAKCRCNW